MKIAYTAWTWLQDEHNNWEPMSQRPKRDFEQSLRDLHDCGYKYLEDFNVVEGIYRDDVDELKALLKKYEMEFVNLYCYFTHDFESDLEVFKRCLIFMNKMDIRMMNIEPPRKAPGQVVTSEEIIALAEKCNIVGKLCADAGVGLYLHPHWGTYIETENQIDLLLEHTNRDYLNLCLDTAHTTLCGMNPAKLFDKYLGMGVVKYIHMKDINGDPDSYPEYPPRRFRALGYGIVDFPAVQKVLQKHGYDGVLCVELDFNRVNNYDSAKRSRQYIHDVLGY